MWVSSRAALWWEGGLSSLRMNSIHLWCMANWEGEVATREKWLSSGMRQLDQGALEESPRAKSLENSGKPKVPISMNASCFTPIANTVHLRDPVPLHNSKGDIPVARTNLNKFWRDYCNELRRDDNDWGTWEEDFEARKWCFYFAVFPFTILFCILFVLLRHDFRKIIPAGAVFKKFFRLSFLPHTIDINPACLYMISGIGAAVQAHSDYFLVSRSNLIISLYSSLSALSTGRFQFRVVFIPGPPQLRIILFIYCQGHD